MSEPINLGPWPLGVNNVDDPKDAAFQPPSKEKPAPPFLRVANNVDALKEGLRRRTGRTKRVTFTDGHSGVSIGGMALVVDSGDLKLISPSDYSTQTLEVGLGSNEVSYAEMAGAVYWSNGQQSGRIQAGAATFWGLEIADPPVVSLTSGGLVAGRYLVAVVSGRDGVESGARGAASIDVPEGNYGIVVTPRGIDPGADTLHVYCSGPNRGDLFWVKSVLVGTAIVVDRVDVSTDLFDGMGVYPPPPGQIVRAFNGRMLIASGATLYWSEPIAPHRFQLETDFQMFQAPIVLLEPMPDGFYVAVEDGPTWWVAGDDPANWRPRELTSRPVCQGAALRLPGHKVPWAQTSEMVAVWGSADGWVAGLPSGALRFPTDGRIAMDTHTKATLAYREEDGLRQILMSLRDKTMSSRLGTSDRASAVVYKADGTIQ